MAYASRLGRARISSKRPQAAGVCDRCGAVYNHVNLKWQMDWRGSTIQNIRLLVCNRCYDTPQQQLRAIILPADPTPIMNARVENYNVAETDFQTISAPTVYDPRTGLPIPSTTTYVTQDGSNLTMQEVGRPLGLQPGAVMPLQENVRYGVILPILSVSANGTTIISVTCSSPHGLSTNNQISVLGLSNNNAVGFFSVSVTSAPAFTYTINSVISASGLLQGTTIIQTVIVGLPYNFTQIPLTGP